MPAIWTAALLGVDISEIRIQQLHAAMSWLMDREHSATRKDWSLAPPGVGPDGQPMIVIRTLTSAASAMLQDNVPPGTQLRLGRQAGTFADAPARVQEESWASLGSPRPVNSWTLEFLSPTSMARGTWYSPLIRPESLLVSLLSRWSAALAMERESHDANPLCPDSPMTELADRRWTREDLANLHVTDIEGRTVVVRIPRGGSAHHDMKVVPGFVGTMALRATNKDLAQATDCLLRFSEYCGVGAEANHGMGTVRPLTM